MAIELSELKLKLGDIIKIESTKQDYHLKYFFIEYIDDELIKIVNIDICFSVINLFYAYNWLQNICCTVNIDNID